MMTLKHNGKKWPRMTEMLSEADNPSHGLMPWVGRCAIEYIGDHCRLVKNSHGHEDLDWYVVERHMLLPMATHYKTVSQEALDV